MQGDRATASAARAANLVVCCVYEDLVEDLVQAGGKGGGLEHHPLSVVHPQLLLLLLRGADVRVRTQEDVLQLLL